MKKNKYNRIPILRPRFFDKCDKIFDGEFKAWRIHLKTVQSHPGSHRTNSLLYMSTIESYLIHPNNSTHNNQDTIVQILAGSVLT